MNSDGGKLHENLLKYKIKFRSTDHELPQPLQSNHAGAVPVAVFATRCLTQEDAESCAGKIGLSGGFSRCCVGPAACMVAFNGCQVKRAEGTGPHQFTLRADNLQLSGPAEQEALLEQGHKH